MIGIEQLYKGEWVFAELNYSLVETDFEGMKTIAKDLNTLAGQEQYRAFQNSEPQFPWARKGTYAFSKN